MIMFLAGLLLLVPSSAVPQDEPTLKDQFEKFVEILKTSERDRREGEAIALIDEFVTRFKANAKRRTAIEELLDFGEGDARDLKKEAKAIEKEDESLAKVIWLAIDLRDKEVEANQRLWTAAAYAWGQMGAHGSEYLWAAGFEPKRFRRDFEFQALCVEQVGVTQDYRQVDQLLDTLDYHNETVAAAAGKALQHFGDAPGEVRKISAERLVKLLESRANAATNVEDTTSIRIYRIIRPSWMSALTALTGETFTDPLDWTRWWNKNKKNRAIWADRD
ncbi:MAG TPA: hypothetical protein VGC54_00445 [Planctomycetota bacterium]